jgi:uncharacterized membrane protein YkvI
VEKTRIFWVGLTISELASVALFLTIWIYLTTSRAAFNYRNMVNPVPPIVGCIVFLLIGLYMMKGEKTTVFWVGLFILGLASTVLFSTLWLSLVLIGDPSSLWNWSYELPLAVGSVVFMLIGLYMMKSGTE